MSTILYGTKLQLIIKHILCSLDLVNNFPAELMQLIIYYFSRPNIVCCNGSQLTQIGFAGSNFPEFSFSSTICRNSKDSNTTFDNIIENGCIRNWNGMKSLWDYSFHDCLQFDNKNIMPKSKILLSETLLIPFEHKRKIYEYMFDEYGFESVILVPKQVLILYSQGLLSGVVLDSGAGTTECVPIYEGYALPARIHRLNIGGRHVTKQLISLLQLNGYVGLHRCVDFKAINTMKEQLCYIAYDLDKERNLAEQTIALSKHYKLPDGRIINVNRERFEALEVLFEPSKAGISANGVGNMLFDCIQKCDIELRSEFFRHIILCGGNTYFHGFSSRLEKDIKDAWVQRVARGDRSRLLRFRVKIKNPVKRENMVFLGASVLADIMKDSKEFWLNRNDFYEKGAVRAVKEHHMG